MSLNLEVQILGEYKNLTRATKGATNQLKNLQSQTKRISSSINATLATIGVGLTLGGLATAIKGAVTEASNLEQGIGAARAVFKGFADSVVANSRTAANAFGLSATQYLQSANLIGAQLSNLGFTQEEYTKRSQDLVALGADLAATFGGTTYDAVLALSAVFRGEYNQVEKYGVAIRKSDINARVAARGQATLTGELLKQAEAQAALEILYGQTAAAQGQFARETDTFAGAMQILRANVDNAKIAIGDGFAPAITNIAQWITDNIGVFNDLTEAIGTRLKSAFENTGDSAESFGASIINTINDLTAFLNGTAETGNVFKDAADNLKPFTELLAALGEIGKGIFEVIKGIADGLFGWLGIFTGVEGGLANLNLLLSGFGKFLQDVGYWIGQIISFFIPFTAGFKVAGKALGAFSKIADNVVGFFSNVGNKIAGFFGKSAKNIDNVTKATKKYDDAVTAVGGKAGPLDDSITKVLKAEEATIKATSATKYWDAAAAKVKGTYDKYLPTLKKVDTSLGIIRTGISTLPDKTVFIDIKTRISGEDTRFNNLRPGVTPNPYATPDYLRVIEEQTAAAAAAIIDPPITGGTGLTPFQQNVKKLVDTLTSALEDAKKRIKNASENFRDAVSLSFGVITNGAFAVFDINRVLRQMRRLVDGAKNFAKDIKKLQQQGADQSLIDQLLGMDPLQGAATASGLLSSGRLQEFLDLRSQLSGIGAGAGGVANFGIYGTGTGGLSNAIESLTKTLERGYGNTYTINVNNANKMSGQEIVAAIKRYEKTTGRPVL